MVFFFEGKERGQEFFVLLQIHFLTRVKTQSLHSGKRTLPFYLVLHQLAIFCNFIVLSPAIHTCTLVYCWRWITGWQNDMKKWALIQSQCINFRRGRKICMHFWLTQSKFMIGNRRWRETSTCQTTCAFIKLGILLHLLHILYSLPILWGNSALCQYSVKKTNSICQQSVEGMCTSEIVMQRLGMWKGKNLIYF